MTAVVGIDIGGTHVQVGVVDAAGTIVGRVGLKTEAGRGLDHVLDRVVTGIDDACSDASLTRDAVAAVGVATAGAIDWPRGVVLSAPNLDWHNVPLRDLLHERLRCPVVVDNDVNGAMWGEFRLGAARDAGDCLGVWVGTGVGGGLVFGGTLYRGPRHTAGEVGQTIIDPDAAPGERTVEERVSRSGLQRLLARRDPAGQTPPPDTATLKRRYDDEDLAVRHLVNDGARLLGIAIANWVTLLALERVVVGGGIVETFGADYVERVRTAFQTHVFPPSHVDVPIVPTALAADAGLFGAAFFARDLLGSV